MATTVVRPMAIAHCRHCTWTARSTDDTMIEAVAVLRIVLRQHVQDDHPDQDCTGPVEYRTMTVPE
jgi:hypothetical protein